MTRTCTIAASRRPSGRAFGLAQQTNRYLDAQAPWQAIRTDRESAATTLWTAIAVLNCLKMVLFPFLPFSSQSLHEFLGLDGKVDAGNWDFDSLVGEIGPGSPMRRPAPLFKKLDPESVEEEIQRLGVAV